MDPLTVGTAGHAVDTPAAPAEPSSLRPAVSAFDAIAESFDSRYGGWRSVTAQRRAVRRVLARSFPLGSRLLEVGGGTGEDARWLARHGRRVLMTDPSPRMVETARQKLEGIAHADAAVVAAEDLVSFAVERSRSGLPRFDGAFSNFAALNCVADLRPVAAGLASLLDPAAPLCLVMFGPLPPGEILVQLVRGDARAAVRRLHRGAVVARLGGQSFDVHYHRPRAIIRALQPWFRPVERVGIGIFVPPSAAEPWISRHRHLLRAAERIDGFVEKPLAMLGDHVLYRFARTTAPVVATQR